MTKEKVNRAIDLIEAAAGRIYAAKNIIGDLRKAENEQINKLDYWKLTESGSDYYKKLDKLDEVLKELNNIYLNEIAAKLDNISYE